MILTCGLLIKGKGNPMHCLEHIAGARSLNADTETAGQFRCVSVVQGHFLVWELKANV